MPLGLLHQVFARPRIGQVEAVLVDQHGLLAQPLLPRFLGDVLPDALAELTRVGREFEALGLAAELHTLHHPGHRAIIRGVWRRSAPRRASRTPSNPGASCRAPGAAKAARSRPRAESPARETSGPRAWSGRRACA